MSLPITVNMSQMEIKVDGVLTVLYNKEWCVDAAKYEMRLLGTPEQSKLIWELSDTELDELKEEVQARSDECTDIIAYIEETYHVKPDTNGASWRP